MCIGAGGGEAEWCVCVVCLSGMCGRVSRRVRVCVTIDKLVTRPLLITLFSQPWRMTSGEREAVGGRGWPRRVPNIDAGQAGEKSQAGGDTRDSPRANVVLPVCVCVCV